MENVKVFDDSEGVCNVACAPTSEGEAVPGSSTENCRNCQQEVWVAPSTRAAQLDDKFRDKEFHYYCTPCTISHFEQAQNMEARLFDEAGTEIGDYIVNKDVSKDNG